MTKMSKQHFELIAGCLAIHMADSAGAADVARVASIAHTFASVLPQTNPSFDKARFLAACGVAS